MAGTILSTKHQSLIGKDQEFSVFNLYTSPTYSKCRFVLAKQPSHSLLSFTATLLKSMTVWLHYEGLLSLEPHRPPLTYGLGVDRKPKGQQMCWRLMLGL